MPHAIAIWAQLVDFLVECRYQWRKTFERLPNGGGGAAERTWPLAAAWKEGDGRLTDVLAGYLCIFMASQT